MVVEAATTGAADGRIEREIACRVRAAAAVPDDALPPLDQQQLDVLLASHAYLRPAVMQLLASLELAAAPPDRVLLDAIAAIRGGQRSRQLDDVSVEVLPKAWRTWMLDDGCVRRVRYELALWLPFGTRCAAVGCTDPSVAAQRKRLHQRPSRAANGHSRPARTSGRRVIGGTRASCRLRESRPKGSRSVREDHQPPLATCSP